MTYKSNFQEDLKTAMKAKDKVKLETIRALLSEFQYAEMQSGKDELTNDEVIAILKREAKKRSEEIEFAEKGDRAESLAKSREELAVIESYLPKQMSEQEIEVALLTFKGSNPSANMGTAMSFLKEKFAGQYDGKVASAVAKRVM